MFAQEAKEIRWGPGCVSLRHNWVRLFEARSSGAMVAGGLGEWGGRKGTGGAGINHPRGCTPPHDSQMTASSTSCEGGAAVFCLRPVLAGSAQEDL